VHNEKVRKTKKCITRIYAPSPSPKKKVKTIFAFDLWNPYVILVSRSECSVLSCQFAVDSCLYHCNVDQELNVLQLKCNNEFFFIVELHT